MNYPNGGRCMACTKLVQDCSSLDFDNMKPMGKPDKDGDQEVLCPEHVKNPDTWRILL